MSVLYKNQNIEIVPGTPAHEATAAIPAIPGHYETTFESVNIPVETYVTNEPISGTYEGYSYVAECPDGMLSSLVITRSDGLTETGWSSWLSTGFFLGILLSFTIVTSGPGSIQSPVTVWVPATPYIPATVSTPGTLIEISFEKNKGWNTWARSVDPLTKGTFYVFTCSNVNEGFCLGVGSSGQLGSSIGTLPYALIADSSGITIYEMGVEVAKLTNEYTYLSKIKIFHLDDGAVVYAITTGTDTLIHTSTSTYLFGIQEAYIYGYIYSSDDTVLSSEYIIGNVQYGSV